MKIKQLINHPYAISTGFFMGVIIFSRLFYYWRLEHYIDLLLLYFMVILGIRLDDISRQLLLLENHLTEKKMTSGSLQTRDIEYRLDTIEKRLDHIAEALRPARDLQQENGPPRLEPFN